VAKLNVLNKAGQVVGEIELNDEIFAIEPNVNVMHAVVKNYLANQRQGTQSAKTRAEVSGGGRKPFKQKGTGNARQGSITAPHFVGGGVSFAPKPRDYRYELPKRVKRLAMFSALSSKLAAGKMIIIDEIKMDAPKTKEMVSLLNNLKVEKKALILLDTNDANVIKSANNLKTATTMQTNTINVYSILNNEYLVATREAVKKLEEVYLG
jgi:large subunit ribosomal protein L4